jgi:glycosyltransferase involved in cell wall biosynthesis
MSWIVGKGEEKYLKELYKMKVEYNLAEHIIFWGSVNEKEKLLLMGRSHLLLHASVKEGWGLVVVEAASQGTPAIVYDVAGLRDSVRDGVTGIVIKENSPMEMAQEAIRLFKSKREYKRYQTNCLGWVKSLSWEKATRQSLQFIKKINDEFSTNA